jgi:hypothetical protein
VTDGRRLRTVPVVIDFEASGFGSDSYPIEVGYIRPDGQRFCALIRPEQSWSHWDRRAEAVHGLRRELLEARGLSAAETCALLDRELNGQTVYSDAWNYDLVWLHRLYDAVGRAPAFQMESILNLLTEEESTHWQTMLHAVRRDVAGARHRASTDAATTQLALCRLMGLDPPSLGEDPIAPVD